MTACCAPKCCRRVAQRGWRGHPRRFGRVGRRDARRGPRKARGPDLADVSARLTEIGQPIGITGISRIELGTRRVDADDLVGLAAVLRVGANRLLLPATASGEPMS